jgi:hypothetical protein
MAAVGGDYSVEVSENARITASNDNAIFSLKATISGNSIVEAKENAIAIYIYGGAMSNGIVRVEDQAQVIAANNYAISVCNDIVYSNLYFSGGVIFAFGNKISDVIDASDFYNQGIILAWDKEAGNTNYQFHSTDDIFVSPESATAYWDIQGSKFGISYAKGENTGFIPLDVNVLSVKESGLPKIVVYPNPTNGQFTISCDKIIESIELYDPLGKKVFAETPKVNIVKINTELHQGLYIYRAILQDGATCFGKIVAE